MKRPIRRYSSTAPAPFDNRNGWQTPSQRLERVGCGKVPFVSGRKILWQMNVLASNPSMIADSVFVGTTQGSQRCELARRSRAR
jgi:hypothetical protein